MGISRVYDLKIGAFILAVIAAFSLSLPAFAQDSNPPEPEALVLTDERGEYRLGLYLDILDDPTGLLTIQEVSSPEFADRFERSRVEVPIYGYTDHVYWLRLKLRNEASLTNQWLLETVFQNLNYVDLFLPNEEGGFIKKESGALRPFNAREIPYYHIVFRVPLLNQEEQTLYLRAESGGSMTLAFDLWSPETFATQKFDELLIAGLFYGALLIILGYHLFLYLSLKESAYLYFVFFLTSAILFFATYEGVADQFLWPGLSQEKKYLLVITMALLFIASLRFSDVFLEQKTRAPRFHLAFNLFIGFWVLLIVILPFASFLFMAQITSIGLLITPVLIIVAGFYAWRKRYLPARYYLVSWVGFLLGILAAELVRMDALPSTPLTERSYQVGLIWLVLLSSLALADRIKLLKSQTEEANRLLKVNENRLSQILEGLPLGVVVYGKDQKPNYINQRSVDILSNPTRGIQPEISAGRTPVQAIGYYSFRKAGTEKPYPAENLPVVRAFRGEEASVDDIEADLVDTRVSLEIWANPIKDDKGEVEAVVAAFQDITSRKQTELELNEYRDHLERLVGERTAELSAINTQLNEEVTERKFLEAALYKRIEWLSAVNRIHQSINRTADLPDAYSELSATIIQILGAKSVFIGMYDENNININGQCRIPREGKLQDVKFVSLQLEVDGAVRRDLEQGNHVYLTAEQATELPSLIGECFQGESVQTLILAPMKTRQAFIGIIGLGMDQSQQTITQEDRIMIDRITLDLADLAEDALLFEKAQALVAAEERNRLARDLHDSVTQVLFSASLVAEVLPKIWLRDPKQANHSLEELRRLTRGALAEMRTMLLELRPSAVDKTPLGELLAQLTEAITARSGLPFQIFIEQIPTLPEDVHASFYRIAQEGLNNVVKHAQASLVTVSLNATRDDTATGNGWQGEIKLVIRDNGKGFSAQDGLTEHMGMGIIRERAAAINATVSIDSQQGLGTELSLVWHS